MQALNYTPKVIEQFMAYHETAQPLAALGFKYLADKLRQAQVFVLPDHGELLERDKPRPEVPGLVFKPPFPVVALEYGSPAATARRPGITEGPLETIPCSKRIALAWEWADDLPAALRAWAPTDLPPGVTVASLSFVDQQQTWMPVAAAVHFPYDGEWTAVDPASRALRERLVGPDRKSRKLAEARVYPLYTVGILPEALFGIAQAIGVEGMHDSLTADIMDEANAYIDLCYALGCGNVETERRQAPERLNRQRLIAGKLPLMDFHILKLTSAADGEEWDARPHGSPRSHLRRGHIRHLRHLGPDRITWVNATMVRGQGRGFVDKVYTVEGATS